MLQLGMLLEFAFQNGITTVDFGSGESPHKEQSGPIVQQSLIEVEFYAVVSRWSENRLHEVAERVSRKSLFFVLSAPYEDPAQAPSFQRLTRAVLQDCIYLQTLSITLSADPQLFRNCRVYIEGSRTSPPGPR